MFENPLDAFLSWLDLHYSDLKNLALEARRYQLETGADWEKLGEKDAYIACQLAAVIEEIEEFWEETASKNWGQPAPAEDPETESAEAPALTYERATAIVSEFCITDTDRFALIIQLLADCLPPELAVKVGCQIVDRHLARENSEAPKP